MNWQCRLYGHQWCHPGVYEVILVDGTDPSYPFQCALCGAEMLMDAIGTVGTDTTDAHHADSVAGASIDMEPELEQKSEPDADEE